MKTTTLGKSPLKVSRMCLGTMMFGDQTPLEDASAIVADAQEKGCNFIDTADVYTLGKSEEIVGQVLKGQRHSWVRTRQSPSPTNPWAAVLQRPNKAGRAQWLAGEPNSTACRPTSPSPSAWSTQAVWSQFVLADKVFWAWPFAWRYSIRRQISAAQ